MQRAKRRSEEGRGKMEDRRGKIAAPGEERQSRTHLTRIILSAEYCINSDCIANERFLSNAILTGILPFPSRTKERGKLSRLGSANCGVPEKVGTNSALVK